MTTDNILEKKGAGINELFKQLSRDEQNQLFGIAIGLGLKHQEQKFIRPEASNQVSNYAVSKSKGENHEYEKSEGE